MMDSVGIDVKRQRWMERIKVMSKNPSPLDGISLKIVWKSRVRLFMFRAMDMQVLEQLNQQ
jgi:hypothetical protein